MRALYFTAYYCGACKMIWDEVIEPLIDEGFEIEEIDAMKRPSLAERYKIKGVPTVVIVQGNTPVSKLYGRLNTDELRSLLRGR